MLIVDIHDVLSDVGRYIDQTVEIHGPASFLWASVWLHDDPQSPGALPGRVAIAASNRKADHCLIPPFTGGIPEQEMRTPYRLLTIAGTLRKSPRSEYVASLEDLLWLEKRFDPVYWEDFRVFYAPAYALRQGISAPHPRLQPGMAVQDVIARRNELFGSVVRISGITLARDPKAGDRPSTMAATLESVADPSRAIVIDEPSFYWAAKHLPLGDLPSYPQAKAAKGIITARLAPGDGANGTVKLEALSEACLTSCLRDAAAYRCFHWPLRGSENAYTDY